MTVPTTSRKRKTRRRPVKHSRLNGTIRDWLYSYLKYTPILILVFTFGRGCFRDEISAVAATVAEETTEPMIETMAEMRDGLFNNSQAIIALTQGQELSWNRHVEDRTETRDAIEDCMHRLEARLDKLEERTE